MIDTWAIEHTSAIDGLRGLADNSVSCCVTSVPYYGLRSYGTTPQVWGGDATCAHIWSDQVPRYNPTKHADRENNGKHGYAPLETLPGAQGAFCIHCNAWLGEYGSEPTPELYIANTVEIFREVRRVLHPSGTLWLNIGDSFTNAGRSNQTNTGGRGHDDGGKPHYTPPGTLGDKQLLMLPARVAIALQADGWVLRSEIVWSKGNPMPESCDDRPSKAHEMIYLLSKRPAYFYDALAIREGSVATPGTAAGFKRVGSPRGVPLQRGQQYGTHRADREDGYSDGTRNARTVWNINTQPANWEYCLTCGRFYQDKERSAIRVRRWTDAEGVERKTITCQCGATDGWVDHYAAFPPELPRRCVAAGSSEHGVCSECFAPWVRVVEKERAGKSIINAAAAQDLSHLPHGLKVDPTRRLGPGVQDRTLTVGWASTCNCEAPICPALVLDPFVGSGTTVKVARELFRRGLGYDLNARYAELARIRVAESAPLFNRAVEIPAPMPAPSATQPALELAL